MTSIGITSVKPHTSRDDLCSLKISLILTKKECIKCIMKRMYHYIIVTNLLYKEKVIVPFMKTC